MAAYAVIGEPLFGRWAYARLVREHRHDRTALLRFYQLTLTVEWAWTVLIAATLTVATDLKTSAVGLAVPAGPDLPAAAGIATYMAVVVAVSSVILRRRTSAGKAIPGQTAVAALANFGHARGSSRRLNNPTTTTLSLAATTEPYGAFSGLGGWVVAAHRTGADSTR